MQKRFATLMREIHTRATEIMKIGRAECVRAQNGEPFSGAASNVAGMFAIVFQAIGRDVKAGNTDFTDALLERMLDWANSENPERD